MSKRTKTGYYLPKDLAKKVRLEATQRGIAQGIVIEEALTAHYEPDQKVLGQIAKTLTSYRSQVSELRSDMQDVFEFLALIAETLLTKDGDKREGLLRYRRLEERWFERLAESDRGLTKAQALVRAQNS